MACVHRFNFCFRHFIRPHSLLTPIGVSLTYCLLLRRDYVGLRTILIPQDVVYKYTELRTNYFAFYHLKSMVLGSLAVFLGMCLSFFLGY